MTLALYGKSRRRQGSLLLAAFLAIIAATVGGLAIISSAFAHHLEGGSTAPTCSNQNWSINITEGQWSGYREAVLTLTDATTPVGFPNNFDGGAGPFLDDGTGSIIISKSGTGAVHSAGKVDQYLGDFTTWTDTSSTNIDDSTTSLVRSGSGAWNTEFVAGRVILWDNELMKITARSANGKTLTVIRGFGYSDPALHSSNGQAVWKRGALDSGSSTPTISWNLQFDPADCGAKIIVKKTVTGANPPATNFPVNIDDLGNGVGSNYSGSIAVGTDYTQVLANVISGDGTGSSDNDDFTVTETNGGTGWTTVGWAIISSTAACGNDLNGASAGDGFTAGNIASGGALNDMNANDTVVVCFKNSYTAPSVPINISQGTCDSASGPGFTYHFNAPTGTEGGSGGGILTVTFKYDSVAAEPAIQKAEDTDGNGHPDWHVFIPFNGHGSITILSATSANGGVWGGNGTPTVSSTQCATPGVTIDKSHDPAGPFGPGASFKWKLAVTVTGAATTSATAITDSIPAPFIVESETDYTKPAAISCTNTDAYTATVECSLASGTNPGTYTVEIDITIPSQLSQNQCHAYDNTATVTGTNVNGTQVPGAAPGLKQQSDTDSVTITCTPGTPEFSKSDGNVDGSNIYWTITIKNNNQFSSTYYVYDENAVLDSSDGCGPAAAEAPNDFFSCTLAAGATGHLYIHTAYPGHTDVCQPLNVTNTAYLVTSNTLTAAQAKDPANQLASDGGTFHEDSSPNASCLTVKKENTGNGTWVITFTNSSDKNLAVDFSDTYQPASTGTDLDAIDATGCTPQPAAGTTETQSTGCDKTVTAGGSTTVNVATDPLVAKCEAQTVSNTVAATFNGQPIGVANGGSLTASYTQPADTTLCNKLIQITKYYQLADGTSISGFYSPVAADRPTFTLTPNPWTNSGSYNVVDDANCDLQDNGANIVWTCSIPVAANPIVSETPATNWTQSFNGVCGDTLLKELTGLVAEVLDIVVDQQISASYTFCNYPVGSIRIIKNDLTTAGNTARPADSDWDFSATGPNAFSEARSIAFGGGNVVITNVPLGAGYNAAETDGSYDTCRTDGPAGIHQYFTTNVEDGPLSITQPGQEITFTFRNEDCGAVLGTGSLHVFKVRDINGNGTMDGGDTNIVWTVTITGPEFPGGQVFNVPAAGLHLNGITEGAYTITEGSQFGYALIGVRTSENGSLVVSASTSVTVTDGQEDTVTFYNQPSGQIPVHKNAFTSHNGGPNVPAPNDDDGWTITLTSAQCGINQVKVTDANGDALFTGLPLCSDYVVSEGAVNASSPGFVPLTAAQFTNITPNGVTLTFNNILRTNDPICTVGCIFTTPTPTPVTPTATPTTATPVPPTNTPVPPTATPTQPSPVSTQAGERTPGPGQPTPIAPSTGGGVLGGTAGGFNLLLIVAGLLALTSGVSFLALGRKNRR